MSNNNSIHTVLPAGQSHAKGTFIHYKTEQCCPLAAEALEEIDAGLPRHDWVRIAHAFKAAGGDFETFVGWSAQAKNFAGREDCKRLWSEPTKSVGAGTLYRLARKGGGFSTNRYVYERTDFKGLTLEMSTYKSIQIWNNLERSTISDGTGSYWVAKKDYEPTHDMCFATDMDDFVKAVKWKGAVKYLQSLPITAFLYRTVYGSPVSIEFIDAKGRKATLPGTFKNQGFWAPMGLPEVQDKAVIAVGEGAATAWSMHKSSPGVFPLAAGSNSGMRDVMAMMTESRPNAQLLYAIDWNSNGELDPYSHTFALMHQIPFIHAPSKGDIDDFYREGGPEKVKQLIDQTLERNRWWKPEPLPETDLSAVPKFNAERLLPQSIRDYVLHQAKALSVAPEVIAVSVLTVIGAAIGRKTAIAPRVHQNDWLVFPNLWTMIVGRPSARKTPSIRAATKALESVQIGFDTEFQTQMEAFQDALEIHEITHSALKDSIRADLKKAARSPEELGDAQVHAQQKQQQLRALKPPVHPSQQRMIVKNSTVAALQEVQVENPQGVLLERDELGGFLMGLEQEQNLDQRNHLLEGFDGHHREVVDRISRGHKAFVNCLSIIGGAQPGKLERLVRQATSGGVTADGLLQRFGTMIYADPVKFEVFDQPTSLAAKEAESAYHHLVKAFATEGFSLDEQGELQPELIRFDDEAQPMFNDWLQSTMDKAASCNDEVLESHIIKMPQSILALSLIFARIDQSKSVSAAHLAMALDWDKLLTAHAIRVYSMGRGGALDRAKTLLDKIKDEKLLDQDRKPARFFTSRVVAQKGWKGLTTVAEVEQAVAYLEERGYLKSEKIQTGGRPSVRIEINFCLLKHAGEHTTIPTEGDDREPYVPISGSDW